MDLYGSWDAVRSATQSGRSTPVASGPSKAEDEDATSSAAGSPKPQGAAALQAELEQMGSLVSGMGRGFGSYWGSLRRSSENAIKQSQQYASAAATAATPYLDKARAELDKLGEQAKASAAAGQAASLAQNAAISIDSPSLAVVPESSVKEPVASTSTAAADATDVAPSTDKGETALSSSTASGDTLRAESSSTLKAAETSSATPQVTAAAFFSRLSSQLSSNPNFQSFQHNLTNMQDQLKSHVDFSKIDLHDAQKKAEQAMNQGEKYFAVASKELSHLFGEAVRIVPPEATAGADKRRQQAAAAAAGRKETLLHRLREDAEIMLVDPAQPPPPITAAPQTSSPGKLSESISADASGSHVDTREAFSKFLAQIEVGGGLEGEAWQKRVKDELDDETSGQEMKRTFDAIVPSKLTAEAFWTRYFFRVQQIEEDEARRREILEGAAQYQDDDFSWDLEDDSASITSETTRANVEVSESGKGKGKESLAGPSAATSDDSSVQTPKLATSSTLAPAATLTTPALAATATNTASGVSPAGSDVEDSWGISPVASTPSSPGARPADSVVSDKSPILSPTATSSGMNRDEAKSSTPRNSSEGTNSSYDVVSATSGDPGSPKPERSSSKRNDDDEDSDWE